MGEGSSPFALGKGYTVEKSLGMCKNINTYLPILSGLCGFGYLTERLFLALDDLGVRIHSLSPDPYIEDSDLLEPRMLDIIRPPFVKVEGGHPINFMVGIPEFFRRFANPKHAVYTMFESDNLPRRFVDRINQMDLCIVPCEHNIRAFQESGVKTPIKKVPFGNAQEHYSFVKRNWDITSSKLVDETQRGNPFTFYHIGEINWRKGGDLVIRAFRKLFPPSVRDVRLILKFSKGYTPKWWLSRVKSEVDPRIIPITSTLTLEEMREVYGYAHCYVGSNRGEGWGLLIWQALATGCPAIISDWGGTAEYSHLGWPLSVTKKYREDGYAGSEWGWYGEPDFDHLCTLMEHAYQHPEECQEVGRKAAKHIREKCTWGHTAEKLVQCLNVTFNPEEVKSKDGHSNR